MCRVNRFVNRFVSDEDYDSSDDEMPASVKLQLPAGSSKLKVAPRRRLIHKHRKLAKHLIKRIDRQEVLYAFVSGSNFKE